MARRAARCAPAMMLALLATLTLTPLIAGEHLLFLDKPAADWEKEAFPLGNGRLGCMVFGGVGEERLQFNVDSLFLATVAYPYLKEVCHYWQGQLKQLPDGRLVAPNGWSPEHGDTENGVSYDLLQSHAGEIHLLPALPKAWPSGEFTGLSSHPPISSSTSS